MKCASVLGVPESRVGYRACCAAKQFIRKPQPTINRIEKLKFSAFAKGSGKADLLMPYAGAVGKCAGGFGNWMMRVLRLKQWTGLALVGAVLSGCGSSEPTEEQLFAKYKMNDADQSAFKACDKTMGKVQPIITVGSKEQMMKSVPMEICACQSKTMSAVFVEDSYLSFSSFSNYLGKAKKEKLPRLSKLDLKPGMASDSAVKRLLATFDNCTRKYLAANETTGELEGFLLPPPEPKKSKKELAEEKKKAKKKALEDAAKKKQAAAG